MRAILFLLALVALGAVALMQFGFISVDQTRPALVQAPRFEAEVGRVSVGTENKTVQVPTVEVQKAEESR